MFDELFNNFTRLFLLFREGADIIIQINLKQNKIAIDINSRID